MRAAEPLRVALIAPPWYPIPPPAYGGIEAMVYSLAGGGGGVGGRGRKGGGG
jgi:hypothetical protein